MSIEKARIILKAKLKIVKDKLIAKMQTGEIMLDGKCAALLTSIGNNRSLQSLIRSNRNDTNNILKNLVRLEELGIIELKLPCEDPILETLYKRQDSISKICKENPAMSNIVAYEREWGIYPSALDFLDKKSQNYKLKNFEKEIYFNLIHPFLDKIPKGSAIIDVGGGIGRFALELVKMGYKVHLVDSSQVALKKGLKHFRNENLANIDLHWGNVTNLSMFSDNTFDAAFAIELICYLDEPDKALKELVRVTKKNGLIIISVEGKYGSSLSDSNVSSDKISDILRDNLLYIKNHLYVRYYTSKTLRRLLEGCGIKVIDIFGCHYVPDGVFHRLINIDKLDDREYKKELLDIERFCRREPVLKNLARAWVAVGRKK